jgi:hypothetical protein
MTDLLIIVNILLLIVAVIVINRSNKIRRIKFLEMLIEQVKLKNINLGECFSQPVIDVYISVLKDTNLWSLPPKSCTLNGPNKIQIWAANDLDARRFYGYYNEKDSEDDKKIQEWNSNLTHYDKVLLDRIITAIEDRQSILITKFFL